MKSLVFQLILLILTESHRQNPGSTSSKPSILKSHSIPKSNDKNYLAEKSQDNCRQYMSCGICFEDPQCGWCKDFNLCIVGNSTGPAEGSCEWYYYQCPSTSTTSTTTTTTTTSTYVPAQNLSWYQYGGNAQHTGYSAYNVKINENSNYIKIFTVSTNYPDNVYSSPVAVDGDEVFFHLFKIPVNDYLHSWSISSNTYNYEKQMTTYYTTPDYSTGPALTQDGYIISLTGDTFNEFVYPTLVERSSGEIIDETSTGYYYSSAGLTWSIISPVVDDDNNLYYFATSADNSDLDRGYMECFKWTEYTFEKAFAEYMVYNTSFSHQPVYYDQHAYYHFNGGLYQVSNRGNYNLFYQGSEIRVGSSNINSTMVISAANNLLFVVGSSLCAFDLRSLSRVWCNTMNGGGLQGVTPAIDDNENAVYTYDNGYIYSYSQLDGSLVATFGDGNVLNECESHYQCVSSQPIITFYNVIWGDGSSLLIYNKNDQTLVQSVEGICGSHTGNSIAIGADALWVSCREQIVAYKFT